jgi:hypothetical protein
MALIRTALAVALLAAGGVACGGDGPSVEEEVADVAQYCATAVDLNQQAAAAGVVVPLPEGADLPASSVQAVLDGMGGRLDQMLEWAPDEIDEDAETVVEGLRGARTGTAALRAAPFVQAWERVAAHRAQACEGGGSSQGDG